MIDILKKFFALTILLLMIAAPVSAMRLELHPQPIGKISGLNKDKFFIDGATKINGNGNNNYYTKGVAMFAGKNYPRENPKKYGSEANNIFYGQPIYFHFDVSKKLSNLGGETVKDSMPVDFSNSEREIYLINNTAGQSLYLIKMGDSMIIIGTRNDKWIELLDVQSLRKKYNLGSNYTLEKFFTDYHKIIFRYKTMTDTVDVVCSWHEVNREFSTEVIKS